MDHLIRFLLGIIIGIIIGIGILNLIAFLCDLITVRHKQKIEKVDLPKSLLDRLEKPTEEVKRICISCFGYYPVGTLRLSNGLEIEILKCFKGQTWNERKYQLDLIDLDGILQATTQAWETEFWRDEDLKGHIAKLMEKYNENLPK